LPPRFALLFSALAVLICLPATQGIASPGIGTGEALYPTIRTVPSPLLNPSEILSRPSQSEGIGYAAQRAIGRRNPGADGGAGAGGVSTGKAILLNAVAPGAGHLYSGYDRGYLYLGVEAVAWISYLVLREDGNRRSEQAESYAGDPFDGRARWSFDRYSGTEFCGGSTADSTRLRSAWEGDRATFYDLIEADPAYDCGWEDPDSWNEFRGMRSNSEDFLRWARYAGAAVVLNHAIAVLDMVRLSRGFEAPGGTVVNIKVNPSLPHPSGTIRIKKVF
jgi:hypothetical protein